MATTQLERHPFFSHAHNRILTMQEIQDRSEFDFCWSCHKETTDKPADDYYTIRLDLRIMGRTLRGALHKVTVREVEQAREKGKQLDLFRYVIKHITKVALCA